MVWTLVVTDKLRKYGLPKRIEVKRRRPQRTWNDVVGQVSGRLPTHKKINKKRSVTEQIQGSSRTIRRRKSLLALPLSKDMPSNFGYSATETLCSRLLVVSVSHSPKFCDGTRCSRRSGRRGSHAQRFFFCTCAWMY